MTREILKRAAKVVYIDSELNEVLLIHRTATAPRRADMFDLPGGVVSAQDEHDAAVFGWQLGTPVMMCGARELHEETGHVIDADKLQIHETRVLDVGAKLGRVSVTSLVIRGPRFKPVFSAVYDASTNRYILEHDQAIWVPRLELAEYPDLAVFNPILQGV